MTHLINFSLTQVTAIESFRILSIEWALGSFSKIMICGVRKTRKIPWGKKGRTCCCQLSLCDRNLLWNRRPKTDGVFILYECPTVESQNEALSQKALFDTKTMKSTGVFFPLIFLYIYSCQVPGSNDFENRNTPPRGRQKKYIQNWRIRQTVLSLINRSMFWLNFTKICLLHTPYFLFKRGDFPLRKT